MLQTRLRVIEKRNLWFVVSMCFILAGFGMMGIRFAQSNPMLNYGIDFVGGSTVILKVDSLDEKLTRGKANGQSSRHVNVAFIQEVRDILAKKGLEKSTIQITQDKEIIIKTKVLESKKSLELVGFLRENLGSLEVLEIDFIGPSIGEELRSQSLWISLLVAVVLLIYITWRFEFVFGVAALAALLHDALVTMSFASLFNIEINTGFVAVILTILGYSINDTIVVFDRIRENLGLYRNKQPFNLIANASLGQTMVRTINTSVTTLLVIGSLLLMGGTTLKPFCLVLFVGILAGTYSSIFIASPVLAQLISRSKPTA